MDILNASRFLQSYNRIEAQLKLLYNAKATATPTPRRPPQAGSARVCIFLIVSATILRSFFL